MPKVTKKKKEKDADFKKAKLKLGKGKQAPSNATDTSYKARSIALPSQNPLARALTTTEQDPNAEPTTSRGLKLTEVLLTLRHPNAGVRKDGLGALKDVLVAGAEMGVGIGKREGETGKVIAGVVRLLGDDDVNVRKGLLAFLSWYLPLCPSQALPPHLPLLLLQTSSALSHIFPEIRLEACRLVRLLLSLCPDQVIGSWPYTSTSTILEGLRLAVGLGGKKGEGGQTGVSLLPASKLITLRAMLEFIQHALKSDASTGVTFEGWLSPDPLVAQHATMRDVAEDSVEHGWLAGTGIGGWGLEPLGGAGEAAWEIGRLDGAGESGEEDEVDDVLSSMFLALQPLLLSTFLEQAPTAFNVSQTSFSAPTAAQDTPIALCTVSVELCATLARAILARPPTPQHAEVRSCVSDFVRRMTAWFPFQSANGDLGLSLGYAHLAVLLAPLPPPLPVRIEPRLKVRVMERAWETMRAERARGAKAKGKGRADEWALGEVAEWVAAVLTPSTDALASPLLPEAYTAILPLVWTLLTQPPPVKGSDELDIPTLVGTAFLSHLARQSANSQLRKHGDAFVSRLILVHEAPHPMRPFYLQPTSPVRGLLKAWFETLPKILWERGVKDEGASEALLRFLLEVARRGEKGFSLFERSVWTGVPPRLAPFFSLQHASRGLVLGPYTKLTRPQLRALARHAAIAWSEWDESRALRLALSRT